MIQKITHILWAVKDVKIMIKELKLHFYSNYSFVAYPHNVCHYMNRLSSFMTWQPCFVSSWLWNVIVHKQFSWFRQGQFSCTIFRDTRSYSNIFGISGRQGWGNLRKKSLSYILSEHSLSRSTNKLNSKGKGETIITHKTVSQLLFYFVFLYIPS